MNTHAERPPMPRAWQKAEMHFEMAKAAWKLSAKNKEGVAMVIEHMQRSIKSLEALLPPKP